MVVVPRVRTNRDPDARADFLDQLTQEFRVAAVKPLDIDWISDRSTPSLKWALWASWPTRSHLVCSVEPERTDPKDRPKKPLCTAPNWKS